MNGNDKMTGNDNKTGTEVGVDSESEDFINRWARRKAEATARAGEETESAAPVTVEEHALDEVPPPSEPLTDADMPAIETLGEDADVSGFLSSGVSDDLRRAALRKLFHGPKFNICDGLDDYCGDYTKFEPLGDIITADMRFQMERALERLAEAEESEGEMQAVAGEETDSEAAELVADDTGADNTGADTIGAEPANDPSITKTRDDEHDV